MLNSDVPRFLYTPKASQSPHDFGHQLFAQGVTALRLRRSTEIVNVILILLQGEVFGENSAGNEKILTQKFQT